VRVPQSVGRHRGVAGDASGGPVGAGAGDANGSAAAAGVEVGGGTLGARGPEGASGIDAESATGETDGESIGWSRGRGGTSLGQGMEADRLCFLGQ
jgi:hypothetical protein